MDPLPLFWNSFIKRLCSPLTTSVPPPIALDSLTITYCLYISCMHSAIPA